MKDNSVAVQRFMKTMEKIGAEGCWNERPNGSLSTEAYCGLTIGLLKVLVEFQDEKIKVTTTVGLGVKDENRERIDTLLKSINEIIPCGKFFVNEEKLISYVIRCGFSQLEELENPFDLISYGGDMFDKYTEVILKTLLGANMYYITL